MSDNLHVYILPFLVVTVVLVLVYGPTVVEVFNRFCIAEEGKQTFFFHDFSTDID